MNFQAFLKEIFRFLLVCVVCSKTILAGGWDPDKLQRSLQNAHALEFASFFADLLVLNTNNDNLDMQINGLFAKIMDEANPYQIETHLKQLSGSQGNTISESTRNYIKLFVDNDGIRGFVSENFKFIQASRATLALCEAHFLKDKLPSPQEIESYSLNLNFWSKGLEQSERFAETLVEKLISTIGIEIHNWEMKQYNAARSVKSDVDSYGLDIEIKSENKSRFHAEFNKLFSDVKDVMADLREILKTHKDAIFGQGYWALSEEIEKEWQKYAKNNFESKDLAVEFRFKGQPSKYCPRTLGDLSWLTRLELDLGDLSYFPVCILTLKHLQNLDLGGNELTNIPEEIGHLSALTSLDLGGNKLTKIPETIGHLSALTSLDLSRNKLTKIPEEIGHLSALTSLDLGLNKLTKIPEEIGHLSALTNLNLGLNNLTKLPQNLWETVN